MVPVVVYLQGGPSTALGLGKMGETSDHETALVGLVGLNLDGWASISHGRLVLGVSTEVEVVALNTNKTSLDSLGLAKVVNMAESDVNVLRIAGVEVTLPEEELVQKVGLVVGLDKRELLGSDRSGASQDGSTKSNQRRCHCK